MRSFIAASTTTKLRVAPGLTCSTRVEQQPGVADDRAARIEDQRLACAPPSAAERAGDEGGDRLRRLVAVADADAAADVDVLQADAGALQPVDEQRQMRSTAATNGAALGEQRADVAADADDFDARRARGAR